MGKPAGEARAAWAGTETEAERKARAQKVLARLSKAYPVAKTALDFTTPFELLIATVLSAQSTDKGINILTKSLFKKYSRPQDYLASKPGELEVDIRASGFFNQKARSIRGICAMLVADFDGEVPATMDELLRLPGVARKTANVVRVRHQRWHRGGHPRPPAVVAFGLQRRRRSGEGRARPDGVVREVEVVQGHAPADRSRAHDLLGAQPAVRVMSGLLALPRLAPTSGARGPCSEIQTEDVMLARGLETVG